jgi:hypothetical protein
VRTEEYGRLDWRPLMSLHPKSRDQWWRIRHRQAPGLSRFDYGSTSTAAFSSASPRLMVSRTIKMC